MRRSVILAAALLAACAPEALPPAESPEAGRAISDRALVIGQNMRAALACGVSMPAGAQDRAAVIEAAALAYLQRQGGSAARDAWLHGIEPSVRSPRQLANWCVAQRPDIDRVVRWLDSKDGEAFATRAAEVAAR